MYFRNYRLWKRFDSQHVKASQMLSKSLWECFYSVFSSFSGKLIWKISPLVSGVNVSQFKCNYLKNQKLFLNFLFYLWNLHQSLNILKKNMMVIANVLPKLQTVNILVRLLSKKRRFRTRFDIQHVKASQIHLKSPWELFYHVFSSFSGKFIWKMSLLVSDKVLGVFVYVLTADGKYPVQGFENFQLRNEIQLSGKRKNFFLNFLLHFWNLHQILTIFKEKMIVIANVFSKLQTAKVFVRKLSKELRFRIGFGIQHVKASQMFAECPWERFYHVFYNSQGSWLGKSLLQCQTKS